jgi:hypothetical protein
MRSLPLGRRSASTGTRAPMRVKSSSVSLTPGLVRDRQQVQHGVGRAAEAMTSVMAFSKASRLRMSRRLDAARTS